MNYKEMAAKVNKAFGYDVQTGMEIWPSDVEAFIERHDGTYLDPAERRYLLELADDGA